VSALKSVSVKLNRTDAVRRFVNITNRFPYAIELRQDRFVVDAKSLLGIFSLDLTRPLTVDIYADQCEILLNDLERLDAI